MKNRIMFPVLAAAMTAMAAGSASAAENSHVIGVPVYDIADSQVMAFRDYLENYIAPSFEGVSFLYSSSIQTAEEEMSFIQDCIDQGAEGIMAFNSYDLAKEVELCAENQVYFLRPSGTVAEADFAKVEDNPYFLGYFGPGPEMEYQAGADMAAWFAEQDYGKEYFILSGGASMGNVMHSERTRGILDALEETAGTKFETDTAQLAIVEEPTTAQAGDITVHICSGYVGIDVFSEKAKQAYESSPSDIVLGVIPIVDMMDVIGDAKVGIIDCFTAENDAFFNEGRLQYVCGKFSSIIGPAFASMYNAITGSAEDFREDGKAFAITQGFWVADSRETYEKQYALSSSIALNAYSFNDLLSVMKIANPEASLDDLKSLAGAYTYEDALARRND